MKKYVMALAGAVTMCLLLGLVSNALAADPNQPKEPPQKKEVVVVGVVSVVKDKDNNITEVKTKTARDLTYQITLDDKGTDLGKTMAGKRVRIIGTVETKGEVKWLTVLKFNELKVKAKNLQPKPKSKMPKNKD
jgi:hypothetical protein